jgi:starch-binding outer membrane protein, SusD/RagB family
MNKNIYTPIAFLILLVSFSSCEKFLTANPKDSVTTENYYETEAQLNTALAGVYQVMKNIYAGNFQGLMGLDADQGFYNRSTQLTGMGVNNVVTTEPKISNTWGDLYGGIERANLLLENINKPVMQEKARSVIRGEALFLRAYYYFMLVTHWHDVPLILDATRSVTDINKARTPATEVYNQIIKDMEEAETLVRPASEMTNAGRVNKSAVRGILARVCLQMAGAPLNDVSKYEKAKYWAEKVIDDGFHSLNPDYKQVFINLIQDKYDLKESIWEVEFYGNADDGYRATGYVGIYNGISYSGPNTDKWGYSYGYVAVNPMLFFSYDRRDLRRDWTIGRYTLSNAYDPVITWFAENPTKLEASSQTVGKFRREYEISTPKTAGGNGTNFPLLRYSDVLLMFAEADVNISKGAPSQKAIQAVNTVRRRAFGKLLPGRELVDSLTLVGAGDKYPSIPTITITGGGGTGAKAVIRTLNSTGGVASFVLTDKGSGYTSAPTVEVGNVWKPITSYNAGDVVSHGANLYDVVATGSTTTTPPVNTTSTSDPSQTGIGFRYRSKAIVLEAVLTSLNNLNVDAASQQVSSYENFMKLIKEERFRELAFEALYKKDLVRWGEYVTAMKYSYTYLQDISRRWLGRAGENTSAKDVLWPIPSSEITTNNLMTQNTGW